MTTSLKEKISAYYQSVVLWQTTLSVAVLYQNYEKCTHADFGVQFSEWIFESEAQALVLPSKALYSIPSGGMSQEECSRLVAHAVAALSASYFMRDFPDLMLHYDDARNVITLQRRTS